MVCPEEQKKVAGSISEASRMDAAKGNAVRQQRKAFDSLLNTRIKLQKALVGVNSVVALQRDDPGQTDDYAIKAAEEAAFALWSSLNDFREQLDAARTGSKRKRGAFEPSTSTERLWEHTQSHDDSYVGCHRLNIKNANLITIRCVFRLILNIRFL